MPRPLWKGAISFGMVSIPVRLYTATDEKDVRFNMLHEKDHSRIRQKTFCAEEDVEVSRDEIVKGYQIAPEQYVVLDDEDFDNVPVSTTRTIEIMEFVSLEDIDPILYQKTYYLEPEDVGMKPFALLMAALRETGRVGIAKVAFRQKEQVCSLRLYENTIALETMFFNDEIRSTQDLVVPGEDVQVSERELKMATSLVDMLTSEGFNFEEYKDNYREALLEVIRAKSEGQVITAPAPAPAQPIDLMEALRRSVEDAQKKRQSGEVVEQEEVSRRRQRRAG